MTIDEINGKYEDETGKVIVETLNERRFKPLEMPGVIVLNHGPFTWGKNPKEAVHNAKVLEEVAKMSYRAEKINNSVKVINEALLTKHYMRKHGKNAYYGQKTN